MTDIWTQVIQHRKGNSEKGTPSFYYCNMRGTELWCCDNLQLCETKVELDLLYTLLVLGSEIHVRDELPKCRQKTFAPHVQHSLCNIALSHYQLKTPSPSSNKYVLRDDF